MTNENIKLSKVKKSCRTVCTVSTILGVICAVGAVILLGLTIFAFNSGSLISSTLKNSGFIDIPSVNQQYYGDDPALMEKMALDETTFFDSIAKSVGLFTLVKTIPCIVLTIVFFAIRATFITIEKQDNPFTGKVISRLTTLLVIASVVIGISTGIVYGIMMGFFTYVFYTIMDYGRILQIQSDETL